MQPNCRTWWQKEIAASEWIMDKRSRHRAPQDNIHPLLKPLTCIYTKSQSSAHYNQFGVFADQFSGANSRCGSIPHALINVINSPLPNPKPSLSTNRSRPDIIFIRPSHCNDNNQQCFPRKLSLNPCSKSSHRRTDLHQPSNPHRLFHRHGRPYRLCRTGM